MARRSTCCARSMSTMRPERGFALVAAMFVMIVIALVVAAMSRLSVSQTESVDLSLQQARAYQAARAGLEWGIVRAVRHDCSAASSFAVGNASVDVTCEPLPLCDAADLAEETPDKIKCYRLVASAELGGERDYAWRKLETVVEMEAP